MNVELPVVDQQRSEDEGRYSAPQDVEAAGSSRRWLWALIALAVVIAAGTAWYFMSGGGADAAPKADQAQQVATITVVRPGTETVTREIKATGTLAARREIPVGVVGEGGQVVRVLADAGQWVSKGQPLVVVDRQVQVQQLAALQAQVGIARADLELAGNELSRALALVDRGFISKADVDRKRAARDGAAARVRAAEASVAELRARTARLDIRAPVSGYILERKVEVGQVISAGTGWLFRMADGGQMELQAKLSEDDLAQVSVGVAASVTPVGTDGVINGQIWQVAPFIDETSRQGIARIALPFAESLRPGGFASAVIRAGALTAPLLPESAVLSDREGNFVYVVGKDNKVERRPVKTGLITARGLVIAEGLNGSETVVLRAGGFLNPGETIKPKLVKPEEAQAITAAVR